MNETDDESCTGCGIPKPTEQACILCGTPYELNATECTLCGTPIDGDPEFISEVESGTFATVASSFSEELSILDSLIRGEPLEVMPKKHIERPWLVDGTQPPLEPDDAYHIFAWVQKQRKSAKMMFEKNEHMMAIVVLQYILTRMKQRYEELLAAEPDSTPSILASVQQSLYMARMKHVESKIHLALDKMESVHDDEEYDNDLDSGLIAIESARDRARRFLPEIQRIITESGLEEMETKITQLRNEIEERFSKAMSKFEHEIESEKELIEKMKDLMRIVDDTDTHVGAARVQELRDAIDGLQQMISQKEPSELLDEMQAALEQAKSELAKLEDARRLLDESDLDIE